jgi:hypothetical protein
MTGSWGSEEFRQELLERMEGGLKRHHTGALRKESAQVKAEKLLAGEFKRRDLEGRAKGDPKKIKIAGRLRQETTMTWAWIAEHLAMGAGATPPIE